MPKKRDIRHEIEEDFEDDGYYEEVVHRKDDQKQMLASVSEGNLGQLRKLISRGVNPDFWNKFGMTPLHIAASALNTADGKEMVELLVYYGAMLDRRDRFGQIPLHIASSLSSDGVLILLEAGSHVNAQDNAGRTPLMLACHGDSSQALTVVQYLLDRGAKVSVKDGDGQTALHYITSNMKMDLAIKNEIVYKLLYAGISVDVEDNRGKTALFNELRYFIFNSDGLGAYNNNDNEDNVVLIHRHLTIYKLLVRAGAQLLHSGRYLFNQLHQRSELCTVLLDIALPVLPLHSRKLYLRSVREELKSSVNNVNNRDQFMQHLKLSVENASSLKANCRVAVRERLGDKIFVNASKLGLPKELEKYITYAECF